MIRDGTIELELRRKVLRQDARGRNVWQAVTTQETWEADHTALLLCDVWDRHWSRGADERLGELLPRMDAVATALRNAGGQILHAPSETMAFYANSPARKRLMEAPPIEPPLPFVTPDPPLPVDDSDSGSDTREAGEYATWRRQHPAIAIDPQRDGITDSGREVYTYLRHRDLRRLLILGVHTNMCILRRSFGIKQMVRWGVPIVLLRDLTDSLYNPARPPYVSHEEGTRLVVEYIEKFWCPTTESAYLL